MILLDTDVVVDILRGHAPALSWLQGLGSAALGMPGLVVMELLQGCRDGKEQQRVEQFCNPYPVYWPAEPDCGRALQDFANYRLSHHLGLLDSLIGHTAVGHNEPLATFNVKHYNVIRGLQTIQPY